MSTSTPLPLLDRPQDSVRSMTILVETVALALFRDIKIGIDTARIASLDDVRTEVEIAMEVLGRDEQLDGPKYINELISKLSMDVVSMSQQVSKCEGELALLQSRTRDLVARNTEACNFLARQQQLEGLKAFLSKDGANPSIPTVRTTTPPPCSAPPPTPAVAQSKTAVISFPGGPRTVTIHPPNSPSYQPVIRDDKGEVIITIFNPKSLRREGAFRGPLEEIDWRAITNVYGRGPELKTPQAVPSVPFWPDRPQPSPCPPSPRGPSDIISRQRQLATPIQMDALGRVLPPEYLTKTKSLLPPAGTFSSEPSQDSQSSSNEQSETVATPCLTPPSPSVGRGKKRARQGEEDESGPSTSETQEGASLTIDARAIEAPMTPASVKREELHPPHIPSKRKKLCSVVSSEALSNFVSQSNSNTKA